MTAIVDTPRRPARPELAPLPVRRPLEALMDAHGLGHGPVEAEIGAPLYREELLARCEAQSGRTPAIARDA
jgi:hypothetical protein